MITSKRCKEVKQHPAVIYWIKQMTDARNANEKIFDRYTLANYAYEVIEAMFGQAGLFVTLSDIDREIILSNLKKSLRDK